MSNVENILDKGVKKYEKNPILRALVQVCPMLVAVESFVLTSMHNIEEERQKRFFDCLQKGDIKLNEERIKSNDFLHRFIITYEAVKKTNREEKIELFSNLIISSLNDKIPDTEEFEDYFKIIEDLSWKEIQILMLLDDFEIKAQRKTYGKLDNTTRFNIANGFWKDFIKEISEKFKLPIEQVQGMLARLVRTGCYEILPLSGTGIGNTENIGSTTPVFARLKEIALNSINP